ncbi:hypothetical protein [Actinophytocola algeriensis]|uniref:Uncharacterized protein n=1 Tax=Actinophytocola algeriensis TaxID=1768010 RepID=A0A7W7VJJ4_9PSEU|nr:hypothetical protein [Actinophytocola algeriensis]MBB4912717.1 hypothetical protein [Actinophytocola algeriensis]MBE1473615.1 hypothetical protein [Actinophytocola algeriensis]
MQSDIKLDSEKNGWVTVEGAVLNAKMSDLILEAPAYRTAKGGPYRRALVHNPDDGLTVNFNGDYPGGVRIVGARLRLAVDHQTGGLKLPKDGQVGDLVVVHSTIMRDGLMLGEELTLWMCVGFRTLVGETPATWAQIPFGDVVDGK